MGIPEGRVSNNSYFIEMPEDTWASFDSVTKRMYTDSWEEAAQTLGVSMVALRVIPDPLFPSGAREKPYIAWQRMLKQQNGHGFSVRSVILHVILENDSISRRKLEIELAKKYERGTHYHAYLNGREVFKGILP